jgi:hypothetical protein
MVATIASDVARAGGVRSSAGFGDVLVIAAMVASW